jgi:tetratricopeptide (TPR) repeat protein
LQSAARALCAGAALAAIVAMGWWSHVRAQDWSSERRLFERGAVTSPRNFRALSNLASCVLSDAATEAQALREAHPHRAADSRFVAELEAMEAAAVDRAEALLLRAVAVFPAFAVGQGNLGAIASRRNDKRGTLHRSWLAVNASLQHRQDIPCRSLFEIGRIYTDMATVNGSTTVEAWALEAGGGPQLAWLEEVRRDGNTTHLGALAVLMLDAAVRAGCDNHEVFHYRGNARRSIAGPAAAIEDYRAALEIMSITTLSVTTLAEDTGKPISRRIYLKRLREMRSRSLLLHPDLKKALQMLQAAQDTKNDAAADPSSMEHDPFALQHREQVASTANMMSTAYRGVAESAQATALRAMQQECVENNLYDSEEARQQALSQLAMPVMEAGANGLLFPVHLVPVVTQKAAEVEDEAHLNAAAYGELAVEMAPEDASHWTNLASYYGARGNKERAISYARRAVELAPDNAVIVSNLGYAYERFGYLDEALAQYAVALQMAPDHPQIQTNYRGALEIVRQQRARQQRQ